jgi:hypothetical protein
MRKALICFAAVALVLAAILWSFGHPDIPRSTLDARYARAPSQFLVLPGNIRAHIRDWGPRDGQPLVLIHGSTDSLITWEPWVSRLSDTFRVVTLDQGGAQRRADQRLLGSKPHGRHSRRDYSPA